MDGNHTELLGLWRYFRWMPVRPSHAKLGTGVSAERGSVLPSPAVWKSVFDGRINSQRLRPAA